MNLICLNVRGVNNPIKDETIRNLINKAKAEFVGLVETKLLQITPIKVSSLWGNRPVQYVNVNAINNCSGGLIMMWNPSVFNMTRSYQGSRWLILSGTLVSVNWDCAFGLVYGEHQTNEQLQIYNEISNVLNTLSCPILITGDFNQIAHVNERKNQLYDSVGIRNFREWINDSGLIDIDILGRKFTWRRGNSRSRLDRCLISSEWINDF